MRDAYDVIVIGAGPAGSMAAHAAALRGASVLLVEKRPAIGAPVRCAEGIVTADLTEFMDPDPKWVSTVIRKARFIAPDKSTFTISGKTGDEILGYTLDRKIFDRDLAMKAADAGADVLVHARAVPLMEGGRISGATIYQHGKTYDVRAKVVIAADGVESKFAKSAGINTTVALADLDSCVQYLVTDIDIEPETNVFYWSNADCPHGYIWIFAKGPRSANIGIGIPGTKSGDGHRAKDYLDRFMEKHFPNGKITELIVGGVSTCKPLESTVADSLIICGDAARFSDPFTGGGIYQALYSGRLAGEIAADAIASGDCSRKALAVYEKTWRESRMGKFLARSSLIRDVFFRMDDAMLNEIIGSVPDLHLDEVTVPSVLTSMLKNNPWIVAKFPMLLLRRN
ncbi:MAG TPA: NAD(P)/FAD-dependent oxidoreductase [Methanocorpusculum sp.]|nr:NAD(P)/FAD-dependent oxidoreductase [Methanocorpusculum sp.]HJK24631.1 NAD(P)/FAD-dependent oxidoreductase [Methanocorpusculum sp.]HJK28691.1 NAD(P)/FAD-dependent oxidoreductase [Methanocorpusculum sp.]HJK30243.1 NAD(P)/FAD-dependent oxidoreductase [Methanocorpusculum sp.]HJK33927.1 NAD(P)/FAD-dependent oxidoreductase [Methanocorpusculum sp.]